MNDVMGAHQPLVSIGMPIYNGERFVEATLESVLAQTFADFELIISDNASIDGTQAICEAYAARDRRIRYYRNEQNIGYAPNANRVFELARGVYFKWADHDDLIDPRYLARCVAVLEDDPSIILCHSKTRIIDERGDVVRDDETVLRIDSLDVGKRFYDLSTSWHPCHITCGLMRASALARTPLLGQHVGSDYTLLAMLGLMGRFYEIPEYLFFYREHNAQSIRAEATLSLQARAAWWHPANKDRLVLPHWRFWVEYIKIIGQVKVGLLNRLACYRIMVAWGWLNKFLLKDDLRIAVYKLRERSQAVELMLQVLGR